MQLCRDTADQDSIHASIEIPDNDTTRRRDVFQGLFLSSLLDAVQALQEGSAHLRCFLSYRFQDVDEKAASQVERFLQLHGVEVLTGRSYEPRRVEEKVHSRLANSLDFVVYLVTSTGDSSWLRDEVAEARVAAIPVIPLIEEGVKFEPGLFGNVEYIPFSPGHVGDAWIALTEALDYIRSTKGRGDAQQGECDVGQ